MKRIRTHLRIRRRRLLAAAGFVVPAVNYGSGLSSYLSRAAALSGVANANSFTFSFWVKMTHSSGVAVFGDSLNSITFTGSGMEILFNNVALNKLIYLISSGGKQNDIWYHVCCSARGNPAAQALFINGVSDLSSITNDVGTDNLSFQGTNGIISRSGNGHCMAEFWYAPGQYLDMSVQANREKFALGGRPVDLGSDGSLPTGVAPAIYFKNDFNTVNTNAGTGGNFVKNGTITACADAP